MTNAKLADEIERILAEYHRAVELDDASLLPKIMSQWCDLFFKPGASAILQALRGPSLPPCPECGEQNHLPWCSYKPSRQPSSDKVLVPREPGTCELDDSPHIFAFMAELHSNVPDDKRPTGWSDFSDKQRERIKRAYRAMLSAAEAEGHHE